MKKFAKIFISIFCLCIVLYGIVVLMVFFQYRFWKDFSDKKPIPESEISANISDNLQPSEERVLWKIPSDENIFTQGIFVENGQIFMTSGNPPQFSNTKTQFGILRENGVFEPKIILENDFFGEGATRFDGKIFWTFWKNKKIYIFDEKKFAKIGEIDIDGEGWGLASDSESLILSDGSEFLTFFDKNLQISKKIAVTEWNHIIRNLNELEFIDGKIFANIWLTNDIVIIEPKTGKVQARKNFDFLKKMELLENPNVQEMNGIAFDNVKNEILLTGKMWKNIYVFDGNVFQK